MTHIKFSSQQVGITHVESNSSHFPNTRSTLRPAIYLTEYTKRARQTISIQQGHRVKWKALEEKKKKKKRIEENRVLARARDCATRPPAAWRDLSILNQTVSK